MPKTMSFLSAIRSVDPLKRNALSHLGVALFLVLFSHPLTRSTTTGLFLHYFGAKNSPLVWFYSVLGIMICVYFYDRYQKSKTISFLYNWTAWVSVVIFLLGIILLERGDRYVAYFLFVWKEAYIVLLVHMIFGLANASLTLGEAKIFYGPLGALGSLGGILGGLATSWLTNFFSSEIILGIGAIVVLLSAVSFYLARGLAEVVDSTPEDKGNAEASFGPLKSLGGVWNYVLLLSLIIMMSQFVINLANFKFDLLFAQLVPDKDLKTKYLGNLYTFVNGVGLFMQVFLVPWLFRSFTRKTIHLLIPLIFFFLSLMGLNLLGVTLFLISFSFGAMKGIDYSLFSAAKELMYYALNRSQKYGAKYIVDMVVYRFSKGIISVFLMFYQEVWLVDALLLLFCIIWLLLVFPLIKIDQLLESNKAN